MRLATLGTMLALALSGCSSHGAASTDGGGAATPATPPAASNGSAPSQPTGVGVQQVDVAPTHVLGFPLLVGLTVQAKDSRASVNGLPLPGLDSLAGVEVTLTRRGETEPAAHRAANPMVDEELGLFGFDLRPGEQRRLLFDASIALPEGLAPGPYQLRIRYADEDQLIAAPTDAEPPVSIELLAPTPPQQAQLAALKPELDQVRTWGRWTALPPADPSPPSLRRDDPLRYHVLLRHLGDRRALLSTLDLDVLERLGSSLEPEAALLRAELLAARGDAEGLTRQAEHIRARFPGLQARLEAIEAGRSEHRAAHPSDPWVP
ncbi:MAG: hypothetical protein AAF799_06235 [Myxococcota bacterium]